jgi:hypothetical protein
MSTSRMRAAAAKWAAATARQARVAHQSIQAEHQQWDGLLPRQVLLAVLAGGDIVLNCYQNRHRRVWCTRRESSPTIKLGT